MVDGYITITMYNVITLNAYIQGGSEVNVQHSIISQSIECAANTSTYCPSLEHNHSGKYHFHDV